MAGIRETEISLSTAFSIHVGQRGAVQSHMFCPLGPEGLFFHKIDTTILKENFYGKNNLALPILTFIGHQMCGMCSSILAQQQLERQSLMFSFPIIQVGKLTLREAKKLLQYRRVKSLQAELEASQ